MPNIWVSRIVALLASGVFYGLSCFIKLFDPRTGLVAKPTTINPSFTFRIPSRLSNRSIKVHSHVPSRKDASNDKPLPVYVNFHGGGFVFPVHGVDAEYCTYLMHKLGCIVLDVDYAKAPFHPAPAALHDALDVLAYVASKPDVFDVSRVTLGGFSSGANIAILGALWSHNYISIKQVVAWYPPTDLTRIGDAGGSTTWINRIHRCLRQSYLPPGTDAANPRISPLFADAALFPPLTLIVGSEDKLRRDSVKLHERLVQNDVECNLHIVPSAGHAWNNFVEPNTPLWVEREKTMAFIVKWLS